MLQAKAAAVQAALESAKLRSKQLSRIERTRAPKSRRRIS
jgi:hypothetical protein